MNTEELKKQLEEIDALVSANIIDAERAEEWKERILSEFESIAIPKERRRELPDDLAHAPGRFVGWMIKAGGNIAGAIARGSGATYEGLSKQEGYLNPDGTQKKQDKGKNVVDLYNDLPDMYK